MTDGNATGFHVPLLLHVLQVSAAYGISIDRLTVVSKKGNIRFTGTRSAIPDIGAVKSVVTGLPGELQ